MSTKRDQFREFLRDREYGGDDDEDQIADAAARIWEGPGVARIGGNHGNWYVSRPVLGGYEYLQPDGSWEHNHAAYFSDRAAAEAALKAKGNDP